ncbi:MAG: carbon monoxide dehydrogenase, partial [Firmicutes bacterium]|nr:carbon monoxide dehydrogenase [Bacillota bacterium]
NPNHPNLTIWHNKIDVCIFIGVHCHYANMALKIIRGGTNCYTIALCGEAGHEDAMVTLRDVNLSSLNKLNEILKATKEGLM